LGGVTYRGEGSGPIAAPPIFRREGRFAEVSCMRKTKL
jgi:hypothetical protein